MSERKYIKKRNKGFPEAVGKVWFKVSGKLI